MPATMTDNSKNLVGFSHKVQTGILEEQVALLQVVTQGARILPSCDSANSWAPKILCRILFIQQTVKKESMEKAYMLLWHLGLTVVLPFISHWWKPVIRLYLNDAEPGNIVPVWGATSVQQFYTTEREYISLWSVGHFCHGRVGKLSRGLHVGIRGKWDTQDDSLAFGLSKGRKLWLTEMQSWGRNRFILEGGVIKSSILDIHSMSCLWDNQKEMLKGSWVYEPGLRRSDQDWRFKCCITSLPSGFWP